MVAMWALCQPALAAEWFVVPETSKFAVESASTNGAGKLGDRERPFVGIEALRTALGPGDTVKLQAGTYAAKSAWPIRSRTRWLGGWSPGFSSRDVQASPSLIRTDGTASVFAITSQMDDVFFEGLVFDSEPSLFGPSCFECMNSITGKKPYITLEAAGRVTFRSSAFVNATEGAIAGSSGSTLLVDNVSFTNMRPFAIRLDGSCGYATPLCSSLQVEHSSLVWTARLPADRAQGGGARTELGHAIVIGSGVRAAISNSVIAYAAGSGVFMFEQPATLSLNEVVTFDNFGQDVWPLSSTGTPTPAAMPVEALVVGQHVEQKLGRTRTERIALPFDSAYLQRFLKREPVYHAPYYPPQRAWLISPLAEAGAQTVKGSALTYAAAVAGAASAVAPERPSSDAPEAEAAVAEDKVANEKVPAATKAKTLSGKRRREETKPSKRGKGRKRG